MAPQVSGPRAGSDTALPDRRMISDVPQPSAVARMILARHASAARCDGTQLSEANGDSSAEINGVWPRGADSAPRAFEVAGLNGCGGGGRVLVIRHSRRDIPVDPIRPSV